MMKTVYVGMSGGVDSSVTAALLKQQGYSVTGVYMKNWTQDIAGVECPWKQDLADARAAAAVIDIPFKVMDFQAEYKQQVVDTMVAEYQAGRTPNPDVMCNQEIKFKLFLEAALADGADLIATGHYAQVKDGQLLAATDTNKDQTYFLYRVTEAALKHTLFPLGDLTKPEVRKLAAEFGLPTATKPDSQGICFVGEVGMKEFLRQYIQAEPGPVIVKATGETVGQHEGAIFYTIGQRHGLGIGGGQPYYVTGKDMAANTVYVTTDPTDLAQDGDHFQLEQAHWINGAPAAGQTYQIRSRYRAELIDGTLEPAGNRWKIQLTRAERAISPGQSAVVYDGRRVVGGGLIV
jgi:tRNA-specific 2-thiouridylase